MIAELEAHFSRLTLRKVEVPAWPGGAVWIKPMSANDAISLMSRTTGKPDPEVAAIATYLFARNEAGERLFEGVPEAEGVTKLKTFPLGPLRTIGSEIISMTEPDDLGN